MPIKSVLNKQKICYLLLTGACAQQPSSSSSSPRSDVTASAHSGNVAVQNDLGASAANASNGGSSAAAGPSVSKGGTGLSRGVTAEKIFQDLLSQKKDLEEKIKSVPSSVEETKRINSVLCSRLAAFRKSCVFFGRLFGEEKTLQCAAVKQPDFVIQFQSSVPKKFYLESDFLGRSEAFLPTPAGMVVKWIPRASGTEAIGPRFADLSNLRLKPETSGEVPSAETVTVFSLSFGGTIVAEKPQLINYEEKAGVPKYYTISLSRVEEQRQTEKCRVSLAEIDELILKSRRGLLP